MTDLRPPRWLVVGLAALPVGGLVVFYVWPFATLVANAVDGESVRETLSRERTWRIVWFTSWQALVSTAVTLLLGIAPAWAVARFDFAGRRMFVGLLTAVFVLPTVVMGAAILALLPASLDRTAWAVIAAHVVFNLAVVVRTVGALWESMSTDLEAAAATLGASAPRRFVEVTLPLLRPAIIAAAAVVFVFTFTSFGVIRILGAPGTRTIEVEVWRRATQLGDVGGAAVLTLLQLAMLAAAVAWTVVSQRRHSRPLDVRTEDMRRPPRSGRERWMVVGIVGGTTALAGAPLVAMVVRSFSSPTGWTTSAWTTLDSAEVRPGLSVGVDPLGALRRSIETAAWATLVATTAGALAVLAIAAARRRGRLLDVGLMLPIGTSAVTIGFGMLITFDRDPFDWRASWWLVPVGHALVAVPFVVRTALPVVRSIDPALSAAAVTLGASPARAWREVVLPHLWRPLAVGAAIAAAISLGEFGATSFLSRSGQETLPIAVEQLLGRTGALLQAKGYALATILALATIVLVLLVERSREAADLLPRRRHHDGPRGA